MDRETAVELEKLKADGRAKDKRIDDLEGIAESWNSLIRNVVVKTVTWLLAVGMAGIMFGWHLPENVRKALSDWMSR